MLRKTMIILATVLALGSIPLSATAIARDGGGGHGGGGSHGGGGFDGGHSGGGHGSHVAGGRADGRISGSHDTRHHVNRHPTGINALSDDANCYQHRRYHTLAGWHTRYVYTCG